MIRIYSQTDQGIRRTEGIDQEDIVRDRILWLDMLTPQAEDIAYVENLCGIELPTKDEMREIESTSRLYCEDGARFMTTTVLLRVETEKPMVAELSFILFKNMLITIRHTDSYSFRVFSHQLLRMQQTNRDVVFIGLLETLVDRQADVLERFGADIDALFKRVFGSHARRGKAAKPRDDDPDTEDLRLILEELGRVGDLIARQRDSLVNFLRLVTFAGNEDSVLSSQDSLYLQLRPVSRDVNSLSEYASFLSNQINFMLDAVLGFINIEQNEIVKVFTIMSLVFLPPTLIASVFGMNFAHMPFLQSTAGFWIAGILMVLAAILPLVIFKIMRYI